MVRVGNQMQSVTEPTLHLGPGLARLVVDAVRLVLAPVPRPGPRSGPSLGSPGPSNGSRSPCRRNRDEPRNPARRVHQPTRATPPIMAVTQPVSASAPSSKCTKREKFQLFGTGERRGLGNSITVAAPVSACAAIDRRGLPCSGNGSNPHTASRPGLRPSSRNKDSMDSC